jgi:hypothetical protein
MADQVLNVRILPGQGQHEFSVGQRIEEIVKSTYSDPTWVRQGPNFIKNQTTGEVVNLNQVATASLEAAPRTDAVAVVQKDDGTHEKVFVTEDAVKAVGGDLVALKNQVQKTLVATSVPTWVWVAGGAAVLFLLVRRK